MEPRESIRPASFPLGVAGAALVAAAMAVGAPSVARAQFGRDAVTSRVDQLASRDAADASLEGVVEYGRLAQGQDVTRAYRLQQGSCYWFIAAGDGNIHDLDLIVRNRGAVVVRDQSSTREVVVPGERPYCPPADQRVQVRVVAFRGGGSYSTALFSRAGRGEAASSDDVSALLERAAVRYAPGMSRATPETTTRLTQGESLNLDVQLEGGMCYRFIAVGDSHVEDLSLGVFQGSSELDRDEAVASEAVASYCSTASASVRVRLRMERGSGQVALAPFAGGSRQVAPRRSSQPAVEVGGERDDYLARQIQSHHSRAGDGRSGASEVLRTSLRTSQDHSFPVELEGGRCYTIIAVGSPSVRDLDLYLISPTGRELERETGPESHAVLETSPCPRFSGTFSVRLRAHAGYGSVAVQVFGN